MSHTVYQIRLSGPFNIADSSGHIFVLGAKQQALLALLATASDGTRTRSWLQTTLWSRAGPEQASASLRTALSTLKKTLGPSGSDLLSGNRERIWIDLESVELWTDGDGEFLEGLGVRNEPKFDTWLAAERQARTKNVITGSGRYQAIGFVAPEQEQGLLGLLPTVAVLPFRNLVSDSNSDVLGHILSEQLSRCLSRCESFSVISHLSTRTFGSPTLSMRDVARQLSVDYLITGGVRLSGDRFVIDVDFQSMQSNRILWSREYVSSLRGFLAGDGSLMENIARAAGRTMIRESLDLVANKPLPSLGSHSLLMGGIALMQRPESKCFFDAKRVFDAVIERAPRHAVPRAWLGNWYAMKVNKGYSDNIEEDFARAHAATEVALEFDSFCSMALAIRGLAATFGAHRFEDAEGLFDQAIDCNPNESLAYLHKGTLCAFTDRPQQAVRHTEQALRLSPLDPQRYFYESLSATAHLAAEDDIRALELADASLKRNRQHPSTLRVRTIALQRLGRTDEAQASARDLRRVEPQLTVAGYLRRHPSGGSETGKNWAAALKAAGVPA